MCEAAVDNLRRAFWLAGKALNVIRDARLYRDSDATFEAYVERRWDISRAQAYRLIDAWPLAEHLSPMGDINERQTRELLPVATRHGQDAAVTVYRAVGERRRRAGDRSAASWCSRRIAARPFRHSRSRRADPRLPSRGSERLQSGPPPDRSNDSPLTPTGPCEACTASPKRHT